MSRLTKLSVTYLDLRYRQLNTPLVYSSRTHGVIVAKEDFITDFATTYGALRYIAFFIYALLAGYGDHASTIHDWLYSGFGITNAATGHTYYPTRAEADKLFYDTLRDEGVARWRAFIFYAGVRLFASSKFCSEHTTFNPKIQRVRH